MFCFATGDQPTLPQLLLFEGKVKIINIPRLIGTSYSMLGIILLQDSTGARLKVLEMKHHNDPDRINLEILSDWIAGQGLKPVTWDTLITVLRAVGLDRLASDVRECFTNE